LKFKGGYNIFIQGRPESSVQKLPEPKELYLPLHSRRFYFSNICVKEGQRVEDGDVLAKDPENYSVPLLAPRGGTVRLKEVKDHIVLDKLSPPAEKVYVPEKDLPHIVQEMGASGLKRYRLLSLGAWQFFYDAYTGQLPDPLDKPQAVIVSTLSLEPFEVRGDVQLKNRLLQFTRGLEHLQSLLEYQPMYLVMPDIKSEFATLVREHIRGYAWAKLIEIPLKYPYDNFNILARKLGLKKEGGPIWSVRTEGILAVDRALTVSKPCLVRIVSISGQGVNSPAHLKAMAGYPVKEIIDRYVFSPFPRIINGGIFTGTKVTEEVFGLETECRGITILPEHVKVDHACPVITVKRCVLPISCLIYFISIYTEI
jgi:Na+-translocating ferredoxin:NAD+ oxidoreductase RnfC subunit